MGDSNPTIPIIILNVNELNILIKRQKLLDQIKKKIKTQLYVVYKKHVNHKAQTGWT